MKYKSSRGTTITIPDGLTPQQVATIKKDADAGYGTRAQQTANDLGKKLGTTATQKPATANPVANTTANAQVAAASGAGLNPRQQARLDYLLKHRPNDPQVKKLQDIKAGASPNDGSGSDGNPDGTDPNPGGKDESKPATSTLQNDAFKSDGTVDTTKAATQVSTDENTDFIKNWLASHADETDQYGNTIHYSMGPDGHVQRTITQGEQAKKFSDMASAAASSFHGDTDRQAAQDATYGTLTKYYDRDMSRERETAQQELANRGIPYDPAAAQDPNTTNLYGKTLGAIGQKYQGLKDTASQQAVISGNQAYATDSAVRDSALAAAAAGSAQYGGNYGQYQNNVASTIADDDIQVLSMAADQLAKLKGISVQEAIAKQQDATQRYGIKTTADTQKYGVDVAANTSKSNNAANNAAKAAASGSGAGFDI